MPRCIESGASLLVAGLLFACGAPPTKPASSTPITEAQLRTALADGAGPPGRVRVEVEGGVLDLSRIPIDDRHATLLRQIDFGAVRELDLSGTEISPAAIEGLCKAPGLDQIDRLKIDCYGEMVEETPSFTESAVAIARCPALHDLESLLLLMCSTGDAAALAIAESPWTDLKALHLPANDIGPAGATALAASETLDNLTLLRLDHNEIGIDGFRALLASHIVERGAVELNHCKLDDASGRALLERERVHQLSLGGNIFSEEIVDAIAKRFGTSVDAD